MRRMMGVGPSFQEIQKYWVRFPEQTEYLETGFLVAHRQAQNGTIWGPQWEATPTPLTPQVIQGLLNSGGQVSGVWGLQGEVVDMHHHPDSLRAPPFAVHSSDYGRG